MEGSNKLPHKRPGKQSRALLNLADLAIGFLVNGVNPDQVMIAQVKALLKTKNPAFRQKLHALLKEYNLRDHIVMHQPKKKQR